MCLQKLANIYFHSLLKGEFHMNEQCHRIFVWYFNTSTPFFYVLLHDQSSDDSADIHVYASVLYQPSELPSSGGLMYTALEANILSLDNHVANPAGPLIVAACLCHDFLGNRYSHNCFLL